MSLTFHVPVSTPLLIPVLSLEAPDILMADAGRTPGLKEQQLCQIITWQVAQMRALAVSDPVTPENLAGLLEHLLHHHLTHLLILPWNLQQPSVGFVEQAMRAMQQMGTPPSSCSGQLPTVAISDVSPQGPLGGLLPPQPRLDREVERWPGWRQVYTLLHTDQTSLMCLHAFAPQSSSLQQPSRASWEETGRWKQAVADSWGQAPTLSIGKTGTRETVLRKDGAVFARYLTGIVCAAYDVLCSPRDKGYEETWREPV